MAKSRNKYTPKQKVQIVLEAIIHPEGIGAYCRSKGIKESQVYLWRNKIMENADNLFEHLSKKEQNRILRLELELQNKNEVIADLARENLNLKKSFGDLTK